MPAVYLRSFQPFDDDQVARQQVATPVTLFGEFPLAGRSFPVGVQRYAYFYGYLPDYVSSPTLTLLWYFNGPSSGTVTWIAQCAAVSDGDAGRLRDKFFSTSTNTITPAPVGDERLNVDTITLTNNDGLAAGDFFVVRVTRDAGNASAGGTAVIIGASLNYAGS